MSNNQPGSQSNEDLSSLDVVGGKDQKVFDQDDYFDPQTDSSMMNSMTKA